MKTINNAKEERAYNNLKEYRGKKIYAIVNSVSRSGMSRRIEFYVVDNNDIIRIGFYISRFLGYKYDADKGGLFVSGCGMDMIFSVLSSLNYAMARYEGKYDDLRDKGKRIYDNYFVDSNNYGRL